MNHRTPFTRRTATLTLALTLLAPFAAAQTAYTLTSAVNAALPVDPAVKTAQANLAQAQAANRAAQSDPSVLVLAKLTAANDLSEAQASLRSARLNSLKTTIETFIELLEAQENVNLQSLQVQVFTKAVQVAQVKQQVGNATALDVQNARNSLAGGQQGLAAAQATLNLASAKLATQMGVSGPVRAAGAPTFPKLSASLGTLQGSLANLSTLTTAKNNVAVAQLNVKLADNDFTPAQTLQQAKTALANAQRTLSSSTQTASQALASAYQAAQNAAELLAVAQSKEAAAQKQYTQDTARFKSGTISAVDLQNTQLTLKQAQYSRLQAQNNVLTALAALSVASGQNLTGVGNL